MIVFNSEIYQMRECIYIYIYIEYIKYILAIGFNSKRSVVGLSRLLYTQKVPGSNPGACIFYIHSSLYSPHSTFLY